MDRATILVVSFALAATMLSGCLGDEADNIDSAIPVAKVTLSDLGGNTFLFDASASTGTGLKYEWTFGDGVTSTEPKVEHVYEFGDGVYSASLLITDAAGITDVWEEDVQVGTGQNLPPEALFDPETRYLEVGEALTVDASRSTDPEADPITYKWDFNHLMNTEEYEAFREAKSGADYDPNVGPAKSIPELPTVDSLLDKSPGHGGGEEPTVSLFNLQVETNEPVYTMEEPFPDATVFYVRLVTLDVKGASQEILSEEVWPVKVVETRENEIYTDTYTGKFALGAPATVTDATPDDETYQDEFSGDFKIPKNVVEIYFNVSWTQGATGGQGLANDVDLIVLTPSGQERKALGTEDAFDGITLKMIGADNLGKGDWSFTLVGRQGADISWTMDYWAIVDLNPFGELEADYV